MLSNTNEMRYSKHVENVMKHRKPKNRKINTEELKESVLIFCVFFSGIIVFALGIFL